MPNTKPNQELAAMLASHFSGRLVWDEETATYWFHDATEMTWGPVVSARFRRDVSRFIQRVDPANRLTVGRVDDVIKQVADYVEWKEQIDESHISLDDCQLDIATLEPVPYRQENVAMIRLRVAWPELEKAESPVFDKYLADTCTAADGKDNALMRLQLQEIAGFVLGNFESDNAEKAFFLWGKGANGKSPFIDLLAALVGKQRFLASSLAELTNDRFSAVELIGKKLNAKSEEESDKVALAALKEMISGSLVSARRLYEQKVTFRCRTRFVFSTNNPPRLEGMDAATRRRFVIIPFEHQMMPEQFDRQLARRIITSEFPALTRWALDGLRRLRKNNFVFTESPQSKAALDQFVLANNSALEYLTENWERSELAETPAGTLYSSYVSWCRDNGRKAVSSNRFGRECSDVYGESVPSRLNGKVTRCYRAARPGTMATLQF
jgi:putative DNA primase/helicase